MSEPALGPGPAARGEPWGRDWIVPVGLFLAALAIRLVVASQTPFPTTEGSAYYVGVARNIVEGDGLVSDAVWSYATPPLVAPKPAFELWLPMASFISALGMALLGSTFQAAQVGNVLLASLLAPLAWGLAVEATRSQGLDARRSRAACLAAGLTVALLGPFIVASVVPDSFTPYAVFSVAAALVATRVIRGHGFERDRASGHPGVLTGLLLGALLGLAYLSRQEVIWLALAVVLAHRSSLGRGPVGTRLHATVERFAPVVVGGLCVVGPWLLRNVAVLGTPLPGQALQNAVLRRNEDIFAFLDRPGLATYLAQGPGVLLGNVLAAAWDGVVNVLLLPAFPIGLAGLLAVLALRRSAALRGPTAVALLLVSGGLTFASTVILFPVATRWGTFLHASGPLLVALAVMAALGGDALLSRISALRGWAPSNVILAPVALLAVTLLLGLLQVSLVAGDSARLRARYEGLATSLDGAAVALGEPLPDVLMSDRPLWLSGSVGRSAIALPDEPVASVVELARVFDAFWLVVVDGRGRYPGSLLSGTGRGCLARDPVALDEADEPAWLFILAPGCPPP